MRKRVDYDLVERFLQDESLSFNEVATLAGCSSWSVRKFARELVGDSRPMKSGRATDYRDEAETADGSGGIGALFVIGAIVITIVIVCVIGARSRPDDWPPFSDSEPM